MNLKLCKKLRKAARVMAQEYANGEPVVERQLSEIEKNRKMIFVPKRNEDGTLTVPTQYDSIPISLGTMVELPTTVRGIYHRFKKMAKFGVPNKELPVVV